MIAIQKKIKFDKKILNNENLYFKCTNNYRKKLLLYLYNEYTEENRLNWYNGTDYGTIKKNIIEKYKKGEFGNKTSISKYEFYRFQLQFTEDEISFIGY